MTNPQHDELALEALRNLFDFRFDWSHTGSMDGEMQNWPFIERAFLAPTYKKDYGNTIFARLWQQIEESIREAEQIIVAGYSLPTSDVAARERLLAGLRANAACKVIELITPEDSSKTEWAKVGEVVNKHVSK